MILRSTAASPTTSPIYARGAGTRRSTQKRAGSTGRTLGLLGYGSIGQEMAQRAAAFGMKTVVWSRRFERVGAAEAAELPRGMDIRVLPTPDAVAAESDVLSVHLALTPETRNLVGAAVLDRLRPARSSSTPPGPRSWTKRRWLKRSGRASGWGSTYFSAEPAAGTACNRGAAERLRHAPCRRLDRAGARGDRRERPSASSVYAETGRVPNVVNLATRTPATHRLVVRHRDRPGVLAHVFDKLRSWNLNVQETENVIFEGANAGVASINLDAAPPAELVQAIEQGSGTSSACRL